MTTGQRIQLEHFNRFLSRVFSERDASRWVLKGGTGMLARVGSSRATRDVDLYHEGLTLQQARADLIRLASVDLGDHFRFVYAGHIESVGGDTQPYTTGCRVSFSIFVGVSGRGLLHVDLVAGGSVTGEIVTAAPATALDLPRLVSFDYRLFPVADQVADKVCATMSRYGDRASTREKDLVDLVVLARTQDIDGASLRIALAVEQRRRRLIPAARFVVPATWGPGYSRLSASVPMCRPYPTVVLAAEVVSRLVDPALSGATDGKRWSHTLAAWV